MSKNKQRAVMPVVPFQSVLMGLLLFKFLKESDELSTVFLLIGEEFDAEVLCDVIHSIA